MQPIQIRGTQKLSKTERFFEKLKEKVKMGDLDKYGEMGVEALKEYTPKDTNDALYNRLHANSPVIIFDMENVVEKKVKQTGLKDKIVSGAIYAHMKPFNT